MVTKFQQGATPRLDVKAIVDFFGGHDALAYALEKNAIIGLTPAAIRMWVFRKEIPTARLMDLKALAAKQKKTFKLSRFRRKKPPIQKVA
jgi:hypothetical protein